MSTAVQPVRVLKPGTRIKFDDDGPDALGRRRFTLLWDDPRDCGCLGRYPGHEHFGREAHEILERGQCFFAVPPENSDGK